MEWKLVPQEREMDMRVKGLIAFNTAVQNGKDHDDALGASWDAMLAAAPKPEPLTDHEILDIALANGFKLKEQPDGSWSLNPYVWRFAKAIEERAAQEPVTVIDGFLKQDPSSIPTTDEHNAMLLEQIEELRESLHSIAERSNKLFSANAELVKATEAFLEYMDTNEPVFPEQFETVITNLRAAMDKVKP